MGSPMSLLDHDDTLYGTEYSSEDAPTWPAPTVRPPASTYPDDESTTVKTSTTSLAIALASMGLAAFAIGCSGSSVSPSPSESAEAAQTRTITGKLAIASYGTRIDNPVLYAMSAEDEKATIATVDTTGRFSLTVAANKTYQLLVANRGAGGRLTVVSQVSWRSGAKIRWAKVTGGGEISIGNVRPVGAAISTQTYGSEGGDESDESSGSGSGSGSGSDSGSTSSSTSISSCSGSGSTSADGDSCYSDLPYDAKLPVGATYFLEQSFWEKGPSPAKIIKVEVEGGWREAELKANTPFVVTQADCDHQGNKDVGRDRIFVTWQNFDGSTETDHLDMRYCLNEPWPPAQKTLPASCTAGAPPASPAPATCDEEGGGSVCTGASPMDSECDAPGDVYVPSSSSACDEAAKKTDSPCEPKPAPPADSTGPCGCVPENGACTENAQCGPDLACFGSVCKPAATSVR
jgi:hypothetical protein